ncbi:MAG: DUF6441 family protein, partial [Alphaproteobacteria bacterium]|nr:DUF6441 family protein [Alphaproteobacteria bacterium]
MRLEAAIQGNLEQHMKAEVKAAGSAVVAGTRRAADGLKHEMRAQVTSAGLGHRLANSWRGRVYENKKLDAAGRVWTKAPTIMRAFDEGVTIKSKKGLWLAIPTPAAPRRGVGGKRITDLSKRIPVAAKELLDIGATAGQLGVSGLLLRPAFA